MKIHRVFGVAIAAGLAFAAGGARAESVSDLSQLSLEELGDVQVTSVSKRVESVGEAASSIYVLSHDDIVRSGALTLPEALRLAPNLQVAQTSASRYVITARGLNGAPAAQNFSNKLLVLIDGRSVYTPIFSGVYWDMQDVPLQDVERIEVISGPGATLWGANAVNGVINIITRTASDTPGGYLRVTGGEQEGRVDLRLGGRLSERLALRAYATGYFQADSTRPTGGASHDHWARGQGGFRLDWAASDADQVTVQGDLYKGSESQAGADPVDISGRNLTARWTRSAQDGSSLQVQAYYDRARRGQEVQGAAFWVNTYDLDVQASTTLGRHQLVYGGGYRVVRYDIQGTQTLFWIPSGRTLNLGNAFVQDTIALSKDLRLTAGLKVEADPYLKPEVLPNVRLAWSPTETFTLWGSASRAIRSATPFDRDVVEKPNPAGAAFLIGGPQFHSEKLTAYEVGTKIYPNPRAALALTAYAHRYDDLRSIETAPGAFLPLRWGNGMRGRVYGLEAWGEYQAADWWRLSAAFTSLREKFWFQPGASGLLGATQAANDPKHQVQVRSSMAFERLTFDTALRHVSAMPNPRVAAYTELDARLAWALSDQLTFALNGANLLHETHVEYAGGARIPRSVTASLELRF